MINANGRNAVAADQEGIVSAVCVREVLVCEGGWVVSFQFTQQQMNYIHVKGEMPITKVIPCAPDSGCTIRMQSNCDVMCLINQ